ncbi:MAG: hypothetical protein LBG81_07170 [Coriobacteriaceae bacterium]|jgi:hypothetical protein|nr:hypothetical protein [Coriobacteriaceae bacterium]
MAEGEFGSSHEAVAQASEALVQGLGGYCAFRLESIAEAVPVPGSSVRDGLEGQGGK